MPFITKLDFSNNRQVKQYPETLTNLSGATTFGVPFSYLPVGPDLSSSYTTQTLYNLTSTFSGNSGTTVYAWSDSRMNLATAYLSALTPSISAETQNTGDVYTAATTGTSVDGYPINTSYTGVSFDVFPNYFVDLGGGNYSGTVYTNILKILAAGAIDFTGKTLWVDVSGITRTDELIISKNPQIGYAWTCTDVNGNGKWGPFSGISSSYWTAGTLTNSLIPINNLAGNNKVGINIDPQTAFDLLTTNGIMRVFVNESVPVNSFVASGNTSGFTQFAVLNDDGSGGNIGLSMGTLGANQNSYLGYGNGGESFIYASVESDGLNIIENYSGSHPNKNNFIRFYAGKNPSTSTAHIHIQGSGTSVGYVGLYTTSPTQRLDVNGSGRFRSVGSLGGGSASLYIDTDGTLSLTVSDERLKENITPITNALSMVKSLQGVNFDWKSNGQSSLGFIAQDVNSVEPKLTFTNENTEEKYMGVHYELVTALLVEAIKELSSGSTISGNTYLETQSIVAEDNNIDLNYSGNQQTSIDGGIRVLHALGQDQSAELLTDVDGNWKTNNDFKPKAITIPTFTPSGSTDINGSIGNMTRDEDYLYIKTSSGWKRSNLENF